MKFPTENTFVSDGRTDGQTHTSLYVHRLSPRVQYSSFFWDYAIQIEIVNHNIKAQFRGENMS